MTFDNDVTKIKMAAFLWNTVHNIFIVGDFCQLVAVNINT